MTLYTLLNFARITLDDLALPYLWEDEELVKNFSLAEEQACRRALILKDKTTAAYCTVAITSGTSLYTLSQKILKIFRAKLLSEEDPLTQKTRLQLDDILPGWDASTVTDGTPLYFVTDVGTELTLVPTPDADNTLNLVVARLPIYDMAIPVTGTTISFTASNKTIAKSGETFLTKGYAAGKSITISGSSKTGNNSTFTIASATETTIVTNETLTDETAGSSIIISSTPEIQERYHYDLIKHVCELAYLKQDSDTFDIKKSELFRAQFDQVFGPAKPAGFEQARLRTPLKGGIFKTSGWI
jgi:hypothetical protein